MNWQPYEIEFPNETTMVVLPIDYSNAGWALCISKYPVTLSQYKLFLNSMRDPTSNSSKYNWSQIVDFPAPIGEKLVNEEWIGPFNPYEDPDFNSPNKPIVCVTYTEAEIYCNWLNGFVWNFGITTFLPSIDLWNYAAFGKNYSTTNPQDWVGQVDKIHHKSNSPLDIEKDGTTRLNFQGVSDIFGNIWEWCAPSNTKQTSFISNNRPGPPQLRGGGFYDDLTRVDPFLSATELVKGESTRHSDLGFRVAGQVSLNALPNSVIESLIDYNSLVSTTYNKGSLQTSVNIENSKFEEQIKKFQANVEKTNFKINQIKEIKQLVSNSNLKSALILLKNFSILEGYNFENEIITYEAKLFDSEQKFRLGIISYTDKLQIYSQIIYSILQLINDIELTNK